MDPTLGHREVVSLNGWWHTHYDDGADWSGEAPLPSATPLDELPAHAPAIGWAHVEEHMESLKVPGTWSVSRPRFHGVVWHWRPLVVPEHLVGRRLHLRFGAVRLRAEVYLDRRLVGYDLDGHTPFQVEITGLVRAEHRHELELRVTNPGGVGIGEPSGVLVWDGLRVPADHDFGGVWGDVSLIATLPAYLADLRADPAADLHGVQLRVRIDNAAPSRQGLLRLALWDADGQSVADWEGVLSLPVGVSRQEIHLAIPAPRLWSPADPHLYTLRAELETDGLVDALEVPWGLRRVEVRDGGLWLNGAPFQVIAARTAGWYPENLAFPDRAMAREEAASARAVGVNTLVAVEQEATPALLAAADAAGLLVFQGLAGAWARPGDAPNALGRRLLGERLRRLIQRDANHPSVVCWHLSDDAGLRALAAEEDPTRPCSMVTLYVDGADGAQRHVIQVGGQVTLRQVECAPWLPDLPAVVRRYGDRSLSDPVGARWRAWLQALRKDWATYGMGAAFADLETFCQATQALATEATDRAVAAHGPGSGILAGPWALDGTQGACGLVDFHRAVPAGRMQRPQAGAYAVDAGARRAEEAALVIEVDAAVLDPQNLLQPLRARWGRLWRAPAEGRGPERLLLGGWPGEQAGDLLRAANDAGARVLWLLEDIGAREAAATGGLLAALGLVDEPDALMRLLPPPWGSWLWGYTHPLLRGVAEPGLWDHRQTGLRPRRAFRGLGGETIAAGCSLAGPQGSLDVPRVGATLVRVPLGRGKLVLCTLPVAGAAREGLPATERLLGNLLHWLAGKG
ncbi:MAG: glycoside hydrolase family 2 protein [Anaerolineae bacterium]